MNKKPNSSADPNPGGEFARFQALAKGLFSVPMQELKALEKARKAAKKKRKG